LFRPPATAPQCVASRYPEVTQLAFRAIEKVRELARSAGCQPAVSPTASRQRIASSSASAPNRYSAGWQPAIQQTASLRYDFVNGQRWLLDREFCLVATA